MIGFILGLALALSATTGAFEQGQKNPEANGFLDSKSTSVSVERFLVDEV